MKDGTITSSEAANFLPISTAVLYVVLAPEEEQI